MNLLVVLIILLLLFGGGGFYYGGPRVGGGLGGLISYDQFLWSILDTDWKLREHDQRRLVS